MKPLVLASALLLCSTAQAQVSVGVTATLPAYARPPAPGVFVRVAPPAPPRELRHAPPQAGAVWIPGMWRWTGARYVWAPGAWLAPRPGHVWVPGHWQGSRWGWRWKPGAWRHA
jgi:hypothetical protein